jgi:hypothetical protein
MADDQDATTVRTTPSRLDLVRHRSVERGGMNRGGHYHRKGCPWLLLTHKLLPLVFRQTVFVVVQGGGKMKRVLSKDDCHAYSEQKNHW